MARGNLIETGCFSGAKQSDSAEAVHSGNDGIVIWTPEAAHWAFFMKRVNIILSDKDLERASKIGEGNVSAGIRLALERAVYGLKPSKQKRRGQTK